MARTAIDATAAPRDGVALPAGTASQVDGHYFVNNGRRMLKVTNGTAGALTVEIPYGATVDDSTVPPKVVSVAAGQTKLTGFFGPGYTRPDGRVWINYPSSDPLLTVAVIEPTAG